MVEPSSKPSAASRLEQTSSALTRLTGTSPPPSSGKRRRWWRWLGGILLLLIGLYAALPWLIPVPWLVRTLADDLSRQLSVDQARPIPVSIDAGKSSLSWGQGLILSHLRIGAVPGYGEEPLLTIERIQTDFSPLWYLFTRHLKRMVITEPVLRLVLDRNRKLNVMALKSGQADLPALEIFIEGGEVRVVNPANGENLVAGLKRIHTEIDPFAAKARLSGEFLESLQVDGRVVIDPAETSPIRFAVDFNLPSLNPAAVLGGECKISWDWLDLKKVHGERFLEVATGARTQPAATAPVVAPTGEQTWWQALREGQIGGLSRADFTVKLLPDSRIHFAGKIDGKNLTLPGMTQDQLSAELEGTWDPITKALELTNLQGTGDGWGILPGTSVSYRPEADPALNLTAKVTADPSRLAKVCGGTLPTGMQTQGHLEIELELIRRTQADRWKLEVDLTPLAVEAEGIIHKPRGQAMSLTGVGGWQPGPAGLLSLEHVLFKAPGVLAALDFVDLPSAGRFLQEWQQQITALQSHPKWDAETLRSTSRLVGQTMGKLSAQATLRLDSFTQLAEWLVPLVEPTERGLLSGGLALRASYQPVDLVEETGQVQISMESTSDRPLRIYYYVDKPTGRLLTAEAGWQVNPHTGWFSRFNAELALGRARVRLGTEASWRVDLDEDPQTRELRLTGDIRLPIKVEGVEQWIAGAPVLRMQLARQQMAGDVQLDVAVRTQIGIRLDDPQPTWRIQALRVGAELNAEQLALALRWGNKGEEATADFVHPKERACRVIGDYRYLEDAQAAHETWLQMVLDGGQAEVSGAWGQECQDLYGNLEIRSVATCLAQFPQLAKSLNGRVILGSGAGQWSLYGYGPARDRNYEARLSADLTRIKMTLPQEQVFKDDKVPLHVEGQAEAGLLQGELARLGAGVQVAWDHTTAKVGVSADLRGREDPAGEAGWDPWLRSGPLSAAKISFAVDAGLSNAVRAGLPTLGNLANKYGLYGSAQMHGEFAGQPGEWTGAFDLDLKDAGFIFRNWLRKRPGTPAGVSLPTLIAKQREAEPASLNVIFGQVRLGATRLDFSGGVSGQIDWVRLPSGMTEVKAVTLTEARGLVMLEAPQAGEWAGLCPELADSKPEGTLQMAVLASWAPDHFRVENLDFSAAHFRLVYAGDTVGYHGELAYSPKRLNIPVSELTLGGQTIGILMDVSDPLGKPDGTVLFTSKSFDQRVFSAWLDRAGIRTRQNLANLTSQPADQASQPAPIPTSGEYFTSNPAVYTPRFYLDLFALVKDWRLNGELFAERALIELTKQDGPKNAEDVSLRWKIAAQGFRMDFSASQSGGRISGNLAFPLTEPNPVFHLALNFRDLIWPHTSAHTRFPGLWLYGYEDRGRADLQVAEYDLPNPALTGVGSFYTILDSSTARLFGPGGAMFYEGPGNWHVGQGLMVFGPGYLLGPTNQPDIAKLFPGLNTERMEIERVFNWYEKTVEGIQKDNMLFLSRSGNPLIPTYNFFAVGATQKASTPDPMNLRYLLGNHVDYQIGLDLIGRPNENWKNEIVGRVPLFSKTGYLVPGDREYWNPARGAYSPGKLTQERIEFTPQRLIQSLLWEAHPLRTAYQHVLSQWDKWQASLKKP